MRDYIFVLRDGVSENPGKLKSLNILPKQVSSIFNICFLSHSPLFKDTVLKTKCTYKLLKKLHKLECFMLLSRIN